MLLQNQYLNTAELATVLRLKRNTIERWRTNRTCPFQWIKIGGRVLYNRDDVMAYIESGKRNQINNNYNKGI